MLIELSLLKDRLKKRILVLDALKSLARNYLGDLPTSYLELFHQQFDSLLHHYPCFFAHFDLGVFGFWMNSQHEVGYKSERHSCPNEEVLVLGVFHLQFEIERGILYFFIA